MPERPAIATGTKAETLERLQPVLRASIILPQARFTLGEWQDTPDACLERIQVTFAAEQELIVRSSALAEDGLGESHAGEFDSVMRIDPQNRVALKDAIDSVAQSFGADSARGNQIFAQPFVARVSMSGVVFSRDLDTLAPYYIINYDDKSQSTDSVTSGRSNHLRTVIIFRGMATCRKPLENLMKAVKEVEHVLNSDCLDIEFAAGPAGEIYLLQVRPIARSGRSLPETAVVGRYLEKLHKKIRKLNSPHPYLYGDRTILGVMPDWNPAEMIGIKPRPLALSLYKELITDRTWAYQRDNYGYKNLRSYPLIITLVGHPFIDVRVSFSSFIPKDVPDELSSRLCNYYLKGLEKSPASHDKVEFDIIFSCYFLNLDEKLRKLHQEGFSEADTETLRKALLKLTNNIIRSQDGGVFRTDLAKIEELRIRQQRVLQSELTDLEKIYWLLEDCKRWGTLPFAGLARAGFIAVQLVRSFQETGLVTPDEREKFMASFNTIARQMNRDRIDLSREEFLEKYGHLRPGTYDIFSARYDEAFDLYFAGSDSSYVKEEAPFAFSEETTRQLDKVLRTHGFEASTQELVAFIKQAIEGREYAKFVFTKSVSEVLNLIKKLAGRYQLSLDDASYIDIRTLIHLYATLDHRDLADILSEEISRNRFYYEITKLLKLPALVLHPEDVYEFELPEGSPNFITLGRCQAEVLREQHLLTQSLTGKIVFIPSADPGYDWIFTKNIAGFVTMYGGANSHMAIRSAELRIPAVIGAGEKNYQAWIKANVLEIDSANRKVQILR
jgi:phosphohistidine swiveling domain-containing protein